MGVLLRMILGVFMMSCSQAYDQPLIAYLPKEVLQYSFSFLPQSDLVRVARVCVDWYDNAVEVEKRGDFTFDGTGKKIDGNLIPYSGREIQTFLGLNRKGFEFDRTPLLIHVQHLRFEDGTSPTFITLSLMNCLLKGLRSIVIKDTILPKGSLGSIFTPKLSYLRKVILEDCTINHDDFESFNSEAKLSSLQEINFSGCGIGDEKLVHFFSYVKVPNLQSLNLKGNLLKGSVVKELIPQNFPHLEILNLGTNEISGLMMFPFSVAGSLNLRILDLHNNDLRKTGVITLLQGKFPKLEVLDISSNQVKDFDSGNNLGSSVSSSIVPFDMTSLIHLKMRNNGKNRQLLNSIYWSSFAQLQILDLSGNAVGDVTFGKIIQSCGTTLYKLDISQTRITQDSLKLLTKENLHFLEELDLRYNNLSFESVHKLYQDFSRIKFN